MKALIALLLCLCAVPAFAVFTPPVPVDGNGNTVPSVFDGTTWVTDTGAASISRVDSTVIVGGHRPAGGREPEVFSAVNGTTDTCGTTYYGMLTNGRMYMYNTATGYWSRVHGDTTSGIHVQLRDFQGDQLEFDRVVGGSLVTVDKAHHEIHEQNAWIVSDIDSGIGSGDTTAWVFQGGDYDAHIAFSMNSALTGIVRLYELPTVADSGVAMIPRNFNRHGTGSNDTSSMKWYQESRVGGGTIIDVAFFGGGSPSARVGGGARTAVEWIIPEHTTYAIVFESLAASNYVAFDAEYYEHEAE